MKKLNNRGFAISTMLYSLLIMVFLIVTLLMGIMASNRRNSKDFVAGIEEELNRYSLTSTEFSTSEGGIATGQEYIVPYGKAGWYKIELWGAAGGDTSGTVRGGAGAYTSGIIYLEENTLLYFYIGSQGTGTTGGTNGGGNGAGTGNGGGGATDVRLVAGDWNDTSSLSSRIMVAAGGGGANATVEGQDGGTLEAYTNSNAAYGQGATQIAGGIAGTSASAGSIGSGGTGTTNGAGGGGGYYGGGGGGASSPGGGGSSYISGYAGVATSGNYALSTRYEGVYFIDGMMSENANTGDGKAKIELISANTKDNPPSKKSTKLNNVRYIKDCISGIGTSTAPQWLEVQAMSGGKNVAYNGTDPLRNGERITVVVTGSYGTSSCSIVDLGNTYNLDEIAIWHTTSDTTNYADRILNNHTISVSSDGTNYEYIKNIASTGETTTSPESMIGTHISAWDPDYSQELPDGTYYIFSALSPNTSLITAQNSLIEDTNGDGEINAYDKLERKVTLSPINGSNLQKWSITKNGTYYKIVESESNQAMQIVDNLGQAGSNINTSSAYNETYNWADWEIIPLGDGTYRIKPRVQPSTDPSLQTYLSTNDISFGVENTTIILNIYSTSAATFAQRFYIVNAE